MVSQRCNPDCEDEGTNAPPIIFSFMFLRGGKGTEPRSTWRTGSADGHLAHGLSQQGIWVPIWTPKPLKRTPQDTQILLCGISKNLKLKLIIKFFHLLIIPMTLFNDIMPYFDEFIHVCG